MKWYNNRLDDLVAFLMMVNWLNRDKYILENIHLYTNNYCKYLDQTLFWSWLGYNPYHKKMNYRSDWCIKLNKGVYSCESGKTTDLVSLMQSLLVDKNKTCSQENNLIGSYSVDTIIEDWTYWYCSQPHIDEVTDQIPSWWPVFPSTEDSRQLFSYRTN